MRFHRNPPTNEPAIPSKIVPSMPNRVAAWHEQPGNRTGNQPDDDENHDVSEHGRSATTNCRDLFGSLPDLNWTCPRVMARRAVTGPRHSVAVPHLVPAMPTRSYILVVNGRKVRQPVFVIGAPTSGADLLARALKRSKGFHFTIGQPSVLNVVYAFARTPSIQEGRGDAAATVLRDAFAQAWQVTPEACLTCQAECQRARATKAPGICVDEREIARYGDASPALMYCAEALIDAFPDAKIVQIIRDGRDVVAAMMSDPAELAWFRRRHRQRRGGVPQPVLRHRDRGRPGRAGRSSPPPASARCAGAARSTSSPGCAIR